MVSMNVSELETSAREFLTAAGDLNRSETDGSALYHEVTAGVQRADHPIFLRFGRMIEGHLQPGDCFAAEHAGFHAADSLTVVSFAFHINPRIIDDNSREPIYPSRSWFEARRKFDFLVSPFIELVRGIFPNRRITVPLRSARYRADLSKKVPVSNWSERHVAFACGLGSFGLHGALITRMGCTHRLLSAVVEGGPGVCAEPPDDPYFNCLHFRDGGCGECISRCPVEAIVPGAHIIERCYAHEWMTCRLRSGAIYEPGVAACGLCMCGVPCDRSSPA